MKGMTIDWSRIYEMILEEFSGAIKLMFHADVEEVDNNSVFSIFSDNVESYLSDCGYDASDYDADELKSSFKDYLDKEHGQ